ncbi:hypothetical protein RJD24_18760 [Bacillaceae bacterium IKA-2]|nr:hypothetical protein RJD24_18760 [Bacillaceae bacterium IKA-2]
MARKMKRKPKWYLLFRKEENQRVFLFEPLQKHELNSRTRKGWKVIT